MSLMNLDDLILINLLGASHFSSWALLLLNELLVLLASRLSASRRSLITYVDRLIHFC